MGTVAFGSSTSCVITVSNAANAFPVTLGTITSSDAARFPIASTCSTLAGGANCSVTISYTNLQGALGGINSTITFPGYLSGVSSTPGVSTNRIVAVSAAAARYARDVEGIPGVEVIPNGVDVHRFGPHPIGPGTRILAVGRRVPQKGFDVLLDALPEGFELQVAGDGPFVRDHPAVRWLGRREDLPALFAEADILAVPSRWEGFGLIAAEGLAAGVAVVASDVDGLAEVVGDCGVLVPPEDPGALRAALLRVGGDVALRADLAVRGPRRAREHFDLTEMVRRYEALYRELARR
jgi:glycosyltransferase involved in cell wall biosynthesis